ncbi:head-tail connector protein [Stutzerimonas kunmingensis]|uniref:head-tail connector protein n=1 Tax=Stutzerimonas kunmingensis TaxID=1211807 RepID=UPI00289C8538|nr:head-tail connector protein [Stutzerimonas kunmingensis]
MAVLTLEEIKAHLRVDGSAEDAQLLAISEAAQDYATQYLGRSAIPWNDDAGNPVPVPASVRAAILLVVGDLYENREDNVIGTIVGRIGAIERLLHFYRVGLGV